MRKQNLKPAVIGKDGRTSAIERLLKASPRVSGEIIRLSEGRAPFSEVAMAEILKRAKEERPDFVVVGPEAPLAAGVVDLLEGELKIPCVGPLQELAQLESSKAFTRELVSKYDIPGNPKYEIFEKMEGIAAYLEALGGNFVIKPDGLTGGKGVKVSGEHLRISRDALNYCEELFADHALVVIEEKLEGEEFSLQSFCDGTHSKHMVVVQDHKRAHQNDTGPNTGGMGSYSCEDHSLPFLQPHQLDEAKAINEAVAGALFKRTGKKFKGILYGGFMITRDGIRLLEYNARFGDPEALNVLSVLKTDLVDVCEAIIEETLHKTAVEFTHRATVCKYIVPKGYPDKPVKGEKIDLSRVPKDSENLKTYYASVDERGGEYYLSGSRAVAFVGIGDTLEEAESVAEAAAKAVRGPVEHRSDIGTRTLVQRRVDHVRALSGAQIIS